MSDRKPLPKKIRFEVFKRDSFTCQYCGQSAPNVVLEVDHIKPISHGGTDDMLNLVTSCRDCNRGKGKHELSDKTVIEKQKEQLNLLNERREQMQMIVQWRDELIKIEDDCIEYITNTIFPNDRYWVCEEGSEERVKKLIRQYGFSTVLDAAQIAFDRYYNDGVDVVIDKIGGVCYNKTHDRKGNYGDKKNN